MATTMLEALQREGIAKGREEGRAEGIAEGMAKGQIKSVTTLLEIRFGEISATLRNKLLKVQDDERIGALLKLAATCQSLKEFQKAL